MSKPVTHEEVEDVLSSIRRLVSEDKRPMAGLRSTPALASGRAGAQQSDGGSAAGRLVLTPALRVAPGEDALSEDHAEEAVPVRAEAEGGDLPPLDLGSVAQQSWPPAAENATAEYTAKEESAGEDSAAEDCAPDLDALVQDALYGDAQQDAGESVDDDYGTEDYWDTHEETDAVAGPSGGDGDDETGTMADKVVPLTEKIAALEAAMSGIVQDWEPDGDETEDLTGPDAPAMAWEDDVELDATGAPLETEKPPVAESAEADASLTDASLTDGSDDTDARETPIGAAFSSDDQLMDEEALRDLVSEIVRAELQGALGERITRNVRKLVRREIHRALTAQELE